MEVLGERPVRSMSDSEKLSALDAVVAERARLETFELQLIAGIHDSGYATELGAGDTARLLTQRYRTDATEARRQVRVATRLAKYAATAAALPDPGTPFAGPATAHPSSHPSTDPSTDPAADADSGGWRVHPAQAGAIISVLDQVPTTVPVEDLDVAEQQLINLAATHTPTELRRAGRTIRDILDPDGPEPDEKAAYERESLTLKTVDRGVTFRGYLANDNAELFRTLIHAHAKPHKTVDGQRDQRPRDKRQADGLTVVLNSAATAHAAATAHTVATARTAMDGDPTSSTDTDFVAGHGPKPHISITIDYNDLTAATANATGQLIFGDNLSAATVRRLACDAQILPIILGSKSQPLDVGTTQRLVTRPMRRALNARDKGCVVCHAPPIHCDAHHVVSWLDGGITAVSNLALLCKRDHRDLHSGHWRIRILDGVVEVTRPTWANPTPIPPTKYKPPTADIVHQPITPPLNARGGDERPPGANAGALGSAPVARAAPPTPAGSARPWLSHPWDDENTPDAATSPPGTATVTGVFGRASFDPWGEGATGVG